jgi:hypothetical protein
LRELQVTVRPGSGFPAASFGVAVRVVALPTPVSVALAGLTDTEATTADIPVAENTTAAIVGSPAIPAETVFAPDPGPKVHETAAAPRGSVVVLAALTVPTPLVTDQATDTPATPPPAASTTFTTSGVGKT